MHITQHRENYSGSSYNIEVVRMGCATIQESCPSLQLRGKHFANVARFNGRIPDPENIFAQRNGKSLADDVQGVIFEAKARRTIKVQKGENRRTFTIVENSYTIR